MLDGTIKRHPDGFGFFIPEDRTHPDVYIPRQAMKGAMTNDKVRALVYPEGRGDRFRGEIDQILSRSLQKAIARFTAAAYGTGLIEDSEHAWGSNILIPEGKTLGAKDGELVCIKITDYGSASTDLKGEVVEIVGNESDPMLDIRRVIYSQNLPSEFSTATLEEAKHLPTEVDERDFRGRHDLRNLDFVTIDGATAKDFDDAVYVENLSSGFQVWVAIADVSHYVKPGSAIDKDAYERGNSTYFPNFVIPMLPEQLSNELCSLKPKVPRLAFVAEMTLDFAGELQKTEFYEAVIQSKARVTYGEAQEVFDGSTPPSLKHVEAAIQRAGELAKILMAKRFRNGSLDLEIPDSQIMLDAAGDPIDIIRADRLFAHRTIEELMLLANIAVAIFGATKGPFLYRIHEQPAQDNLEMLNRFLIAFGGTKTIEGDGIQKKITKALQQFAGQPQSEVLSMLTLRAMKQAKYAAENVGHFGLGFNDYTHFTSPIRRYSDLIVHRAMKIYLGIYDKSSLTSESTLSSAGTNLSATEQRSAKAERQFKAIKRARFMQKFLGQEFDGLITSVTKFGVFVMLRTYDVDGLVRLEDLGDEPFEFDDENLVLTGKRTHTTYSLGDPLKIQVAAANPDEGQVTFALVEKLKPTFEKTAMARTKPLSAEGSRSERGRGRALKQELTNREERKGGREQAAGRGQSRGRDRTERGGRGRDAARGRDTTKDERGTGRSGQDSRFAQSEERPARTKLAFGKPLPARKERAGSRANGPISRAAFPKRGGGPKKFDSSKDNQRGVQKGFPKRNDFAKKTTGPERDDAPKAPEFSKRNEFLKRGEVGKRFVEEPRDEYEKPSEKGQKAGDRNQKSSDRTQKASEEKGRPAKRSESSSKAAPEGRNRAAKKSRQFERSNPSASATKQDKKSSGGEKKSFFGRKSLSKGANTSPKKEDFSRGNTDNKSANRADPKKRR